MVVERSRDGIQQALCLHLSHATLKGTRSQMRSSTLENACLRAVFIKSHSHLPAGKKNESCQWIKTDPLVNHFRYDKRMKEKPNRRFERNELTGVSGNRAQVPFGYSVETDVF